MTRELRMPVITGLGVVSTLGVGIDAFWSAFASGKTAPLAPPRARPGVPVPALASTFDPELEAEKHVDPRWVRRLSDLSRMAIVASHQALQDARFPADPAVRDETGVVLGTCFGSSRYSVEYREAIARQGARAASALLFSESVFNAASGHVSRVHGLRGASLTLVGGEEVGLSAIATACDRIRLGRERAILAGGVEQACDVVLASLAREGLAGEDSASPMRHRPFVEGAAVLLIEDEASARDRGARAYARVLGAERIRGFIDLPRPGTALGSSFAFGSALVALASAVAPIPAESSVASVTGSSHCSVSLVLGRPDDPTG